MKKKIVMMLVTAMVVASMSACGSSDKEDNEVKSTVETTQGDDKTEASTSENSEYIPIEELAIEEYITLADYKNITVNATKEEVTEDNIRSYVDEMLLATYPITDRAVENGDLVSIDFVGKKDGVAFDGGTADDYQLEIGSGQFIDGFEEGLIGVMPGETKDLELTFPEEYAAEELAGQQVVFTVTVHSILVSTNYDDVTEEELALIDPSYKSKEEVWEIARVKLEEDAQKSFDNNVRMALIEKLAEESTFSKIPQHLVDEQVKAYNEYVENIAMMYYGMDMESFITAQGMTMDEFTKTATEMSEEQVKMQLVVEALAAAEGIVVGEDEVKEKFSDADVYGYESYEEMVESIGYSSLRTDVVTDKVYNKVKDMIKVEAEEAATATE